MTKTPGRQPVKTRLAADLGPGPAEELYCCFLRDIGVKFRELEIPLLVQHLPGKPEEADLLRTLIEPVAGCFPQSGHDLGARMQQAFVAGFAAGWRQLVLIGGDCPDLPPDTFTAAFAALENADCVLGPTADGGYYLIGFRCSGFVPAVFDFPDWGAETVYAETLRRLKQASATYKELPGWSDVDTLADLRKLWERNQNNWFTHSITMQALRRLWPDA
ncbi:MAG: TIGR04282 family arsenosugar biosynthesis glycosyltransferase [Candidatus Sericytochromatia bacterium]